MKTSDLKTDGTVYVAVPVFQISQRGVSDYELVKVVLLDLDGSPPRDSRWHSHRYNAERRPIEAKVVEKHGDLKRGERIWLSARRVINTAEGRAEEARATEEMHKRWARERAEAQAKNEPLAAELNRLQLKLRLHSSYDKTRPLVEFSVDQYGALKQYGQRPDPEELLETLRSLAGETATTTEEEET